METFNGNAKRVMLHKNVMIYKNSLQEEFFECLIVNLKELIKQESRIK